MVESYFYEPSKGHGLPHDPFKAIVAPRPIGWLSTVDPGGHVNLAPSSFSNAFCEAPPIVGFSSGGKKDSQRNVESSPYVTLSRGAFSASSLVTPIR
jgi:flavin reductase (DIM6/NTAB) family NADH-FMN oxidoreductase RutF